MFESAMLQQLGLDAVNGSAAPGPVKEILSQDELAKLRKHFNEEELRELARNMGKQLPEMEWFLKGILEQFFKKPDAYPTLDDYKQAASRRETQLIVLFLVFSHGQGVFLGIHFYWGLMVGLNPEDLVQTLMLVAMYGGIQILNAGVTTLVSTLQSLKELATEKTPTPRLVVAKLQKTLGPILTR